MLERLLSRFAYLQVLESQQIAACNRLHQVEERLARWLLMSQDRVRLSGFPLPFCYLALVKAQTLSGPGLQAVSLLFVDLPLCRNLR
jgi:hypothetical protein